MTPLLNDLKGPKMSVNPIQINKNLILSIPEFDDLSATKSLLNLSKQWDFSSVSQVPIDSASCVTIDISKFLPRNNSPGLTLFNPKNLSDEQFTLCVMTYLPPQPQYPEFFASLFDFLAENSVQNLYFVTNNPYITLQLVPKVYERPSLPRADPYTLIATLSALSNIPVRCIPSCTGSNGTAEFSNHLARAITETSQILPSLLHSSSSNMNFIDIDLELKVNAIDSTNEDSLFYI
ncbi:hypothetical protein AYI68_g266 [Smittium mucronatum]|uniref:Uncharacterized protein n=1 Tax=Smittium mucronatum TaxID=133383 RepID=A0A1R0H8V7_9FUNG|nr:hypothetical protein AYI68_g266 [Smittium mucronatum]